MKKCLVLLSFVLSSAAFASPFQGIRTLKCVSGAVSRDALVFSVDGLHSTRPTSSLRDAKHSRIWQKGNDVMVGFTNECDNSYTMTFNKTDLFWLARGYKSRVHGKLLYFDNSMRDTLWPNAPADETTDVVCVK